MDALFYKDKMYGGGGAMRGNYFNPIIYSTEEREVGVWTDNKPLYQRTFTFDISSVNDWTLFDNSVSYENLISANGIISTPTATFPIVSNFNDEPRWSIQNNILTYYYQGVQRQGKITVQYTKTTDAPGSGYYTTLGVPAVHYTTDEQVIGTWIDGKPLYQKTLVIHNESTVSSDTTITTIESTFRVKNWKAFAIENGVTYKVPYVAGSGNASFFFRENGNVEFTIRNTSFAAGSDFYITIEYTKTTD